MTSTQPPPAAALVPASKPVVGSSHPTTVPSLGAFTDEQSSCPCHFQSAPRTTRAPNVKIGGNVVVVVVVVADTVVNSGRHTLAAVDSLTAVFDDDDADCEARFCLRRSDDDSLDDDMRVQLEFN